MTWTPEPWTTDMNYVDYPHEVVGCYVLGHADYNRAMLCVNALAGIADPAAFVARAKAIEEAAVRALADAESGNGWGPDVTVCGYLRAALAMPGGGA